MLSAGLKAPGIYPGKRWHRITSHAAAASPVPPPRRPSGCLSAHRGTTPALTGEFGGLGLGQAVVISEKKKRRKERSGPSKRETSAGTQDTAGFQAAGSAINQLQVAPLPRAWLRQAGCSKGKPRQRHGTARQSRLIPHGTWEPACQGG